MSLIDETVSVCRRLEPLGWGALLRRHGLNLAAPDLGAELVRPLPIDRQQAGFEDFAAEGRRAIEPGQPARSLLYHALASPNVALAGGHGAEAMPTLREVRTI